MIIEEPSPGELAPVLMMAYGLTKQEQTVTRLVCRGLSTREIADGLHITPHTLQDHLKSIFDKTAVSSRRELVATILQEQYLPRAIAGKPLAPSGFLQLMTHVPNAAIKPDAAGETELIAVLESFCSGFADRDGEAVMRLMARRTSW